MYRTQYYLTGRPVCPDTVVNADSMYYSCENTGFIGEFCVGLNVVDATYMYSGVRDVGYPSVCGPNVVKAYGMYSGVQVTGNPAIGPNVINAAYMYTHTKVTMNEIVNTRNIKNAYCMFSNVNVRYPGWDDKTILCRVSNKLEDTRWMFGNCGSLNWGILWPSDSNIQNAFMMFMNCTNFSITAPNTPRIRQALNYIFESVNIENGAREYHSNYHNRHLYFSDNLV